MVVNFADGSRVARAGRRTRRPWRAVDGTHLDPAGPDDAGRLALRPLEGVILVSDRSRGDQSGRRPMIVNTSAGSRSSNVKSVPHSRSTKPAVSYSLRAWSRE